MRKYKQLAIEQRYPIYPFRKAGLTLKRISKEGLNATNWQFQEK